MIRLVVASTNPVKIEAATNGFKKAFPDQEIVVLGAAISSGVSNQPFSSKETYEGALNRARKARKLFPDADYWIGLEGGIEDLIVEMRSIVWIVTLSKTMMGKAMTGQFVVPQKIADLVRGGMEMGDADDLVFGQTNSKQKEGGVGLLTNGIMTRSAYYETGVILSLIPFLNKELY